MDSSARHLVRDQIEETVEVAAPPETVWRFVSDLPRLAEWSPQVVKSIVLGGGDVHGGSFLFNINRRGLLFWPTRSKVVRFTPPREVAWRIKENGSTWSFTLEPTATGTRVTHRRDLSDGLSDISAKLTDRFMGGQEVFQDELQAGMRQTLDRIRQLVES
ncbi:SRPBCC family protein [Nocardioides sp. Y6]|uniref:SRPBCC family protein n=1 Tax=Nocardioides malaquae TaxID=2773426 RepID=A0ABR9RRK5_9ACTN|nr:SRPBCC family protein [Nocardioides malaquae]MBE7324217.1 SRPBCC family protein [Nocardioides malaquae]